MRRAVNSKTSYTRAIETTTISYTKAIEPIKSYTKTVGPKTSLIQERFNRQDVGERTKRAKTGEARKTFTS